MERCSISLGCWVQHYPVSVSALARSVESDLMLLILGEFLNPNYLLGDEACFLLESWSSYPLYPFASLVAACGSYLVWCCSFSCCCSSVFVIAHVLSLHAHVSAHVYFNLMEKKKKKK